MSFLQSKLKELLYISIIFLLTTAIYTILIFFNVINSSYNMIRITAYIMGLIIFLLYGLISGKLEQKNGWLAGLTSSIIIIFLTIIINLFTHTSFNLLYFGKLLSYLLCGIIGGMFGVNLSFHKSKVKYRK